MWTQHWQRHSTATSSPCRASPPPLMRRYLHDFAVPEDGLAGFALTAHANGAGNPCAMFRKAIKAETYAKAEMVSDPLNMFDIAPNADGAAALVLTRRELLPHDFSHRLVK